MKASFKEEGVVGAIVRGKKRFVFSKLLMQTGEKSTRFLKVQEYFLNNLGEWKPRKKVSQFPDGRTIVSLNFAIPENEIEKWVKVFSDYKTIDSAIANRIPEVEQPQPQGTEEDGSLPF